jgi:glycosyltransferase involved in cell wall biosynthesis
VSGIPTVYDSVDCISLLFEQTVHTTPQWRSRLMAVLDLARTRRYEAELLSRYDQVAITSQRDRAALEGLAHRYLPSTARTAPVTVVTNGVDAQYFAPAEGQQRDSHTVILSGKMSYHANVAGALYFANYVLPRIWQQNPHVRFQVVGKDPPQAVKQLAQDARIEVTGYVKDLRPYLGQATVAVCPVAYAVGIQNKVLEAMAMQVPVVCTTAAFSGLDARAEEDILVADSPEAFAAQVLRVCSDPGLAAHLAAAGRRYVETRHDWVASAQKLSDLYDRARRGMAADPEGAGYNRSDGEDRSRG